MLLSLLNQIRALFFGGLVIFFCPLSAQAEAVAELRAVEAQVQEHLAAALETVVFIESPVGAGSGVLIDPSGIILTAQHVCGEEGYGWIEGLEVDVVLADGSELTGVTMGSHHLPDLGLVKIEGVDPFPVAALSEDLSQTKIGRWVFALGHPWGRDAVRGTVLRVGKIVRSGLYRLQTDCELLGGDSGGPLFSVEGDLIGIHSFIGRPLDENIHGALKLLDRTLEQMKKGEVLRRKRDGRGGFLGVVTSPLEDDDRVIVKEVFADTSAEKVGISRGDEIVKIDGQSLEGQVFFIDYLKLLKEGETITILIRRGNEELVKEVQLQGWPEELLNTTVEVNDK